MEPKKTKMKGEKSLISTASVGWDSMLEKKVFYTLFSCLVVDRVLMFHLVLRRDSRPPPF